MAYQLRYSVNVDWVPDGATGFNLNIGNTAQFVATGGELPVAGGNTPTSAQFATALTAMATDINTQLNAAIVPGAPLTVLARIQNFANNGA